VPSQTSAIYAFGSREAEQNRGAKADQNAGRRRKWIGKAKEGTKKEQLRVETDREAAGTGR
jgi:hypothetical protein